MVRFIRLITVVAFWSAVSATPHADRTNIGLMGERKSIEIIRELGKLLILSLLILLLLVS